MFLREHVLIRHEPCGEDVDVDIVAIGWGIVCVIQLSNNNNYI